MSAPRVIAPRCAAGMRMLPVPTNGSNTRLHRRTCAEGGGGVEKKRCRGKI